MFFVSAGLVYKPSILNATLLLSTLTGMYANLPTVIDIRSKQLCFGQAMGRRQIVELSFT